MSNRQNSFGLFTNTLNQKVLSELEKKGNRVIGFPEVFNREIELTGEENDKLLDLQKFDWVIFTDIYSVEFFVQKLEQNNVDFFELDSLRVCAYGEAVSDRLRFVQLHADVIANSIDEDEICQQIKDYLFDEKELAGLEVLLLKDRFTAPQITKNLLKAKSVITEISIYQSEIKENITKLKTLTTNGAIDEFIFCSVEDVYSFSKLFYPEKLKEALEDISISAIGEMTFQTLCEFGVKPRVYK